MKKHLSILISMLILISASPICRAADNWDSIADWNIRIRVPDGKTAVLEEQEYYIFAGNEGSIPYVMLRTYSYDDAGEFIADFTEYMRQNYSDLSVVSPAEQKTVGNKLCYEIDYGYTIQGYYARDRRMVITRDGVTYMFCSKEIDSLGMTVDGMLEDVVAGCEFLTAGADTDPGESEFMTVTGLCEMSKALDKGASIESVYYTDGYGFSGSEFTTTDPEEIGALWSALRRIRLGAPTNMSITDWYPLISFTLNDGSRYGVRFEGQWLSLRQENYEIENAGEFWSLTDALVRKYMQQAETDSEYLSAFAPVLEPYLAFLDGAEPEGGDATDRGDYYLVLGDTGISYMSGNGGTLGFCLKDLNADGIPELLIGATGAQYYDETLIYDLFALDDGAPVRVLASSDRVRYSLCEEGLILYQGSGGAAYNLSVLYSFNGREPELIRGVVMADAECFEIFGDRESIFTDRNPEDRRITRDEYDEIADAQESLLIPMELTPFDSASM